MWSSQSAVALACVPVIFSGSELGQEPELQTEPSSGPVLASEAVVNTVDTSQGHLTAKVSLGGGTEVTFNLDTYALYPACIDERMAERMGFEVVGTVLNGDGSGTTMERDVVLIPELRWGGAIFKDVRALVDDYSWVPKPGGGHVDGLMGYPLFAELLLEIDYPQNQVVLRRGELPEKGPHIVSSSILRTQPDIRLSIGDVEHVVGIDTGAVGGLMLPLAEAQDVALLEPATVVGRAQTVYGTEDVLRGTLVKPVVLMGHSRAGEAVTFSKLFGRALIGHELLRHYVLTFDQRLGRVRFAKPKD